MWISYEKGLLPPSELYEQTPSDNARMLLYYVRAAGRYFCKKSYLSDRTNGRGFVLIYIVKGKMRLETGGKEAYAEDGEMLFLNDRHSYRFRALDSLEFIWIYMDGANTDKFCEEIYREYGLVIRPRNSIWIFEKLKQILEIFQDNGRIEEIQASCMLHEILCGILYNPDSFGKNYPAVTNDPQIEAMKRYLREHLNEEISALELANEFHLSISQINRKFREHTGQSPHEYLTNLRINKAKLLLRDSQMTVAEIAGEVGYAYDTSLAAAFRKKMGMSPREFRNMSIKI